MKTDIAAILKRQPDPGRPALIPMLQEVQELEGYLSQEAIIEIGKHLNIAPSKVYGVATFYNQFRFQAPGKYHIQVCRGTACHVKGSAGILRTIIRALGINPGQTTRDGAFSIEIVACMGACGLSPAININGEFYAKLTPEKVEKILKSYQKRSTDNDKAE